MGWTADRKSGLAHRFVVLFCTAVVLGNLAFATAAEALTRTCRATYTITEAGMSHSVVERGFAARGTHTFPTAARERAIRVIESCAARHWAGRDDPFPPAECGAAAYYGEIVNYPFQSLERDITQLVCTQLPGRETIEIDIFVRLSGHADCAQSFGRSSISVVRGHTVSCTPSRQGTIQPGFENLPQMERLP